MKRIMKFLSNSAAVMAVAVLAQSCAMDAPFDNIGEGNLSLNTEIRGDVKKTTRAIDADQMQALREKCVVYIENDKGVIKKFKGVDNIPESFKLRVGNYVAEAWSGDSVSASFDSKFYRGYQKFTIDEGNNSLTLKCNIANVIVSIDPVSQTVGLTDLKVKFSHSRGELTFDSSNISTAKGYFMMPNADKDLNYEITGTRADGGAYSKTGVIKNVERAHEYQMIITEENHTINEGGALIQIAIKDIPVIDEVAEIFPAPVLRGLDFDVTKQVVKGATGYSDVRVMMYGYFGMSSVLMTVDSKVSGIATGQNILSESVINDLKSKGINVEVRKSKDAAESTATGDVEVDEVYVTFTKAFLDALPEADTEYIFRFEGTDGRYRVGSGTLRLANSEAALERQAPVGVQTVDAAKTPMAIGAHEVTLTGEIYDESATGFGIKYRETGTSAWTEVYPSSAETARARRNARGLKPMTKAAPVKFTVKLTGLKAGVTYEYKIFADGYDEGAINTFSTESEYQLVNASFEEWGTYTASTMLGTKTVVFPGTGSEPNFWDSGNEGAATANKTLTNKSTDMVHSGTYSVRMASSSAMSVLAAGNVFIGDYVKTDGTNGVLSLGRPYNGSHPKAVRVWANYRPGKVDIIKGGNESNVDFVKGDNDHGQIYIALTDEAVEIRTNPDNRKLFDPNDTHVLAYNQVTWTDAFGPDGQLKQIDIPFVYNERAQSKRPTHIIIVCCASKFGDFFSGSSSSVMYLDDFQLLYE